MKIAILILVAMSAFGQATLAPAPKFKAFASNGTPLVGGKVCFYEAGSSVPLASYTSSAGTTQNPNPVILDSRGEGDIWLGSLPYKIVLRVAGGASTPQVVACADTAQIWAVDNVTGSGGGGGGGGGGTTLPVLDTQTITKGATDNSKLFRIDNTGIPAFTTIVGTVPASNFTFAGTNLLQTFTQTQTFAADLIPGTAGFQNVGTIANPFSTFVGVQSYWRPAGSLCNYGSVATSSIGGAVISAQDGACATQAKMSATGFDTVNGSGVYKIQGTTVIDQSRNLRSITAVASSLTPTAAATYNLGDSTAAGEWFQLYVRQIPSVDLIWPKSISSTIGYGGPGGRFATSFFASVDTTTIKLGTTSTAGWILTAADALGNLALAAPPTGTLPTQTGQAGKFLTTDGTNAAWAAGGSGITSLNGLVGTTQTFTNDTNVTVTSGGTAHVFGWAGTLAGTRGGLGVNASGFSGVLKMTAGVGSVVSGVATDCVFVNGNSGACGSGSSLPAADTLAIVKNAIDNTKQLKFSAALISSGTTRTMTIPDADTMIAGLSVAQTFSAVQTFGAGIRTNAGGIAIGASSVGGRFGSAHIQNITSTTDANGTGALYVRNGGGALMGTIYDSVGSGGVLNINDNAGTNIFTAQNSGLTATKAFAVPQVEAQSIAGINSRVRVLNSGGTQIFSATDTGAGVELSLNNGSTDFFASSSSIILGHTATTVDMLPASTFTSSIGSSSVKYSGLHARFVNLYAQNAGLAGVLSMKNSSGSTRLNFTADDTSGGSFQVIDGSANYILSVVSGHIRWGSGQTAGATSTLSCGIGQAIKTITVIEGGVTDVTCGTP